MTPPRARRVNKNKLNKNPGTGTFALRRIGGAGSRARFRLVHNKPRDLLVSIEFIKRSRRFINKFANKRNILSVFVACSVPTAALSMGAVVAMTRNRPIPRLGLARFPCPNNFASFFERWEGREFLILSTVSFLSRTVSHFHSKWDRLFIEFLSF